MVNRSLDPVFVWRFRKRNLTDGGKAIERPRLPGAFLDRDGVINIDCGYPFKPEDLRFTQTAIEGIRIFNAAGYRVFVISNQSGVARGLFSVDDVVRFHYLMQKELSLHGAWIDQFYFCPYHPKGVVAEYSREHEDRKPNPGMLIRAMRDWGIERSSSVMIGDKQSDMEAANRAGVRGLLVTPNVADLAAEVRGFFAQLSRLNAPGDL